MLDCLKNYTGISKNPCDCLPEVSNTDVTSSISGIYLESLISPLFKFKYKNCGENDTNFWAKLLELKSSSLKSAILEFSGFHSNNVNSLSSLRTNIGFYDYTKTLVSSNTEATFYIKTKEILGMFLDIKKIGIVANSSKQNVSVLFKKKNNLNVWELVDTYIFNVQGESKDTFKILDENGKEEPIVIPLDGSEYMFSYDIGNGFFPKDNRSKGCCSASKLLLPYFTDIQEYANGFVFDVEFTCKKSYLLCHYLKFDEFKMHIANLINYKFAIDLLLDMTNNPSRYSGLSILNSNPLKEKLDEFNLEYANIISTINSIKFRDFSGTCFSCVQKIILSNSML